MGLYGNLIVIASPTVNRALADHLIAPMDAIARLMGSVSIVLTTKNHTYSICSVASGIFHCTRCSLVRSLVFPCFEFSQGGFVRWVGTYDARA